MRTTIEIKQNQRAELLRMAAERGLKGFSGLVQEALDLYLAASLGRQQVCDEAVSCRGSLTAKEANELEKRTQEVRQKWR